ncbi:MAG TPA: hypothetical protein VLX11_10855 [Candidatus Acidoferrales bacterium]|nr:hypothetical protein [Candidatus Acidoferrales bacterium]
MKFSSIAALLCFFGLLSWVVHSAGSDEQIVVNKGPFGPYYHLRFDLRADAIDFAQSDRTARSGGQFEIRLRRKMFPVPAPRCRGTIILRMPWTPPLTPDAKAKIAAKQELLKRILELEKQPNDTVSVVIELNPYVRTISRAPLKLQLTECNVFFRDAHGAYIDNTEPVKAVP